MHTDGFDGARLNDANRMRAVARPPVKLVCKNSACALPHPIFPAPRRTDKSPCSTTISAQADSAATRAGAIRVSMTTTGPRRVS